MERIDKEIRICEVFDMVKSKDFNGILTLLEKHRENTDSVINQVWDKQLTINKLGDVENLNLIQYIVGRMINFQGTIHTEDTWQEYDSMYRVLSIMLQRTMKESIEHVDSKNNSMLHYFCALGEYELTKIICEKNISVFKNEDGMFPQSLSTDIRIKQLLESMISNSSGSLSDVQSYNPEDIKEIEKRCISVDEIMQTDMIDTENVEYETLNLGDEQLSVIYESLEEDLKNEAITSVMGSEIKYPVKKLNIVEKLDEPKKEISTNLNCVPPILPGRFYLYLKSLSGVIIDGYKIHEFFVVIKAHNRIVMTKGFMPENSINLDYMTWYDIGTELNLKINIYAIEKQSGIMFNSYDDRKIRVGKVELSFDEGNLDIYKNRLNNVSFRVQQCNDGSLFYKISNLFSKNRIKVNEIDAQISYIPFYELKEAELSEPLNIDSLSMWIKVQGIAKRHWFVGFGHIKGNGSEITTQLWKRRLLKWDGIYMIAFNEYNGKEFGRINMLDIKSFIIDIGETKVFPNYVKLFFLSSVVELCFENQDLFNKFTEGMKVFLKS